MSYNYTNAEYKAIADKIDNQLKWMERLYMVSIVCYLISMISLLIGVVVRGL